VALGTCGGGTRLGLGLLLAAGIVELLGTAFAFEVAASRSTTCGLTSTVSALAPPGRSPKCTRPWASVQR